MAYDVEHLKPQIQLPTPPPRSILPNTPPPSVYSVLGTKPMEHDRQTLNH